VQTQYATINVYGGRTSYLDNNISHEFTIAKTEITQKIINHREV